MLRVNRTRWSTVRKHRRTCAATLASSAPRWRAGALLLAAALVSAAGSCVYDEDDRCGPNRVFDKGLCPCAPGMMEMGKKCVPRAEPQATPAGLGAACAPSEMPCSSEEFSYCHMPAGQAQGYCTKMGCAGNADCAGGYACALGESPPYCRRPPTGEGMPCAAEDDCKEFEADFCTVGSPSGEFCAVQNCTDNASCSPGRECMDLSAFVPGLPKLCLLPE